MINRIKKTDEESEQSTETLVKTVVKIEPGANSISVANPLEQSGILRNY